VRSERIPAVAGYLADLASHSLAGAIERLSRNPGGDPRAPLDECLSEARSDLNPSVVFSILGRSDDWSREAFVSAASLASQAMCRAVEDDSIWDRRRTTRTRQRLLARLMAEHIAGWMIDRGMDPGEAARLLREGGVS
jgi:hypothetical protein